MVIGGDLVSEEFPESAAAALLVLESLQNPAFHLLRLRNVVLSSVLLNRLKRNLRAFRRCFRRERAIKS